MQETLEEMVRVAQEEAESLGEELRGQGEEMREREARAREKEEEMAELLKAVDTLRRKVSVRASLSSPRLLPSLFL